MVVYKFLLSDGQQHFHLLRVRVRPGNIERLKILTTSFGENGHSARFPISSSRRVPGGYLGTSMMRSTTRDCPATELTHFLSLCRFASRALIAFPSVRDRL